MIRIQCLTKSIFLLLMIGAVAGCASSPKQAAVAGDAAKTVPTKSAEAKPADTKTAVTKADANKGVVCTYEKSTGSMFREKKCTTDAEREGQIHQTERQPVFPPSRAN